MGNTHYETLDDRMMSKEQGIPRLGIGSNCVIKNSIVDMDACIGDNVQLINKENVNESNQADYSIREGIILIPKNGVIQHNTVI